MSVCIARGAQYYYINNLSHLIPIPIAMNLSNGEAIYTTKGKTLII